jgi:hypothetical protein
VKTSIGSTLDDGNKEVSKPSEWKAQRGQTAGSKPFWFWQDKGLEGKRPSVENSGVEALGGVRIWECNSLGSLRTFRKPWVLPVS